MSKLRTPTESERALIKDSLFHHNGHLYWKDNGNNHHMRPPNKEAGYEEGGGWAVGLRTRTYKAHRIIWFLVYGTWPKTLIRHKNGNKLDNRIKNLELETMSERGRRTDFQLDSTVGIHGIRIRKSRSNGTLTYHKRKKYEARLGLEKDTIVKSFTNLTDACMWLMLERHKRGFKVSHVKRNHYGRFTPINIEK